MNGNEAQQTPTNINKAQQTPTNSTDNVNVNDNVNDIIPPTPQRGDTGGGKAEFQKSFENFWAAYPKKTAKQQALKAWQKLWRELKPDKALIDVILSSLEQQKRSVQWTKDDGQFIPYPASWLNGRRWEDKPAEPLPKSGNKGTCYGHESSFDTDEIMRRARKKYEGSGCVECSFDVDEIMQQVIESYQEPQTDKEKNT